MGRTVAYTYDALGNATSITRLAGTPGATTTSLTYDPVFNKLTSITDPLGHKTTAKYDTNGNLISVTDPAIQTVGFTYDNLGEIATFSDTTGQVTQFGYINGDLATIKDSLGRVITRTSDVASRPIAVMNPLGQTSQYQYNPVNQITQITDPYGNRISLNYDPNGNLLSVTDPNQHMTSYTYDAMDKLTARTDALTRAEHYQYDQDGNLVQFTDRNGRQIIYGYDALNRNINVDFGPGESSIKYLYDSGNRLVQAIDSITGIISRNYDGLDRVTSEVASQGGINYSYDASARRTAMRIPGQAEVDYSYDNDDRPLQIAQGSSVVGFTYDGSGRRVGLSLPNGVAASYSYDAADELLGIGYQSGNTNLGDLIYNYDLSGRRSSIAGSLAKTGLPQSVSQASYDAGNQLSLWGGAALSYDANGNLTSDGAHSYVWNTRGQLSSISGNVSATFQYDPFGRRVGKSVGGATTFYLYDGANPVQELVAGVPNASLLTGLAVDEYFQRTDATGTASFLSDALGHTIALTGSGGSTIAQYTYEPFGKTAATGNSSNSYQYTGRENDGTGLYFYRARYYSPSLHRFISEDPLGFFGGINSYSYAFNGPTNLNDPFGFFAGADDAVLAGGGALIGVGVQLGTDILSGRTSSWQTYVGAAAGGAVGGLAIEYTGGTLSGAAAGATSDAVTQTLNVLTRKDCHYSTTEIVIAVLVGGSAGKLGEAAVARVPGVSSGRGNWNGIASSIRTGIANGTRETVSAGAAAKALVGTTVAGAYGTVAGTETQATINQTQHLSGRKDPCQ